MYYDGLPYTVSDLVHAFTQEDINGIDQIDYYRLRRLTFQLTTIPQREVFYRTGEILSVEDAYNWIIKNNPK